jgi:hypothetical protein
MTWCKIYCGDHDGAIDDKSVLSTSMEVLFSIHYLDLLWTCQKNINHRSPKLARQSVWVYLQGPLIQHIVFYDKGSVRRRSQGYKISSQHLGNLWDMVWIWYVFWPDRMLRMTSIPSMILFMFCSKTNKLLHQLMLPRSPRTLVGWLDYTPLLEDYIGRAPKYM